MHVCSGSLFECLFSPTIPKVGGSHPLGKECNVQYSFSLEVVFSIFTRIFVYKNIYRPANTKKSGHVFK